MMRRNMPCLLILGIYIVCILLTDPRGDFPLNDDWSYTRSAYSVSSGHGLRVDPWAAPSLVGQALYGGLLTKIFSRNFLVLRISTLLLSCGTILLLWCILSRTGLRRDLASIILLGWAFNPLQFSLSFTYMTEVPFLFFAALGLCLYTIHLQRGGDWILWLGSAAFGYAFLIRQTALLFIVALACSILLDTARSLRTRLRLILPVIAIAGALVCGYYLWSHFGGGTTLAVGRKFDLLSRVEARQIIGNGCGMAFYLSFMLLPVWLFLAPSARRLMEGFRILPRIGIPLISFLIAVFGLWWFFRGYAPRDYLPSVSYHARMPFLLNVLYDTGLGPLTLDPDYFAPPPTPVSPDIWAAVTAIVAAGVVVVAVLCVFGLLTMRKREFFPERKPMIVFAAVSVILLAAFELIFSHLQEGGLFDRHVLIISFPLALLVGILAGAEQRGQRPARPALPVALIAVLVLGAFSVAGTHDYMEWNRVRWRIGRELLARGVDPLAIVGGFEFNAWHNYDTFVARGRTRQTSHWWYDRRDYVITMMALDGYEVRQTRAFFSWIHLRNIGIHLARRVS